ncbi:conserved hypothetical protein [Pyrenophora tritici-repentis Pt-1C-BFP]|uniref:Uncharacterized protein n=1 Tax=Pyrenophora tritici-repentis (strain Pt-1C-BFP) TaxID=426418 RepID=B2W4U9_PYRTR|nr:uncharacterized protein PTRG_04649 [Pyrenophora tritici-repentis Pt-1C-BFP]EDU47556.1 conserved hypothetical protein [Pyrenophora tritici-repentis Pt-1C-BFP]
MGTNWASDWSTTTPSLPATPDFGIEATPEPFYTNLDSSEIGFMDPAFLSTAQVKPKTTQIAQPDLVLGDQFAKTPLEQLCSPEPQARDAYMDTKDLKPLRYTYNDTMSTAHPHSFSSSSTIHTPMSQSMGSYDPPQFLADSSKPTPHCCYTLAYSTFQSITGGVDGAIPLNSSVTSTSQQMDSVYHVPFSQPEFPSSLIGAGSNEGTNYALQDMHAQRHRFDELERQRHRRQMVLYELRNCEKLVEALVEWRGNGRSCEQAKYLYGMLGAWLERELHKTVEEIKGVEIPHIRAG